MTVMDPIIRPATESDRDAAHRLLTAQLIEHHLPADSHRVARGINLALAPHSPAWLWLAEREGRPAAISTAPPAREAGIVEADARRYGARAWDTNGARTRGRIGSTVSTRLKIETGNRYWPATSRFAAGCSMERRRPGCARSRSGARLEAIGPSATTATRGGNAAAGIDRGGAPIRWSHLRSEERRVGKGCGARGHRERERRAEWRRA